MLRWTRSRRSRLSGHFCFWGFFWGFCSDVHDHRRFQAVHPVAVAATTLQRSNMNNLQVAIGTVLQSDVLNVIVTIVLLLNNRKPKSVFRFNGNLDDVTFLVLHHHHQTAHDGDPQCGAKHRSFQPVGPRRRNILEQSANEKKQNICILLDLDAKSIGCWSEADIWGEVRNGGVNARKDELRFCYQRLSVHCS